MIQDVDERDDWRSVATRSHRLNLPDFRLIADFRKRHLVALSDLFV